MNDKAQSARGDELPIASPMLALRCCHPVGRFTTRPCGRFARWHRSGVPEIPWAAFCDDHRRAGDVPVPVGLPVRRLRVTLVVDIVAAVPAVGPSEKEALITLLQAIEDEQGRVNVLSVTATDVRNGAPPGPGGAIRPSGRPG